MDTLNLKNKVFLLIVLILVSCKKEHKCNDYVMTYNFTTLTIKNANEDQIKKAKYIIKRNLKIIDEGDFKISEKYSKKELSVKFNFSRDDTIFKNDSVFIYLNNKQHYLTDAREICVETNAGTPFFRRYKIDGVFFDEDEGYINK